MRQMSVKNGCCEPTALKMGVEPTAIFYVIDADLIRNIWASFPTFD